MAIPTDVRNAVVGAYYPRALAVPDGARSRAQAGYGIASAIAAALVAAGVFGNLDERPTLVQAVGVAALVAWLVAAGLYVVAVSRPFQPAGATQTTVEDFVFEALAAAKIERDRVDRWQKAAGIASAVATAVTLAALVTALVDTPSDTQAATVALTAKGKAGLAAACGRTLDSVIGTVSPSDLQKEFVTLTLDHDVCGKKAIMVAVPRVQVQAVAFDR